MVQRWLIGSRNLPSLLAAAVVVAVALIIIRYGDLGWRLRIAINGPGTDEENRVAALILGNFVESLNLSVDSPWGRGEVCFAIRRPGADYVDPPQALMEDLNGRLSLRAREKSTLVPVSDCARKGDESYGVPLGTMIVSVPGAGTFCGEDWEFGDVSYLNPSAQCFRLVGAGIERTRTINGR